MADHYDTAYMEDIYYKEQGGSGARLASAGADDNLSATAALMRAAPIFCELSQEEKLGCDIWLVHLTGEEFPSDCLGARNLCQQLIEGTLKLRLSKDKEKDLSDVQIQGAFILDMVAHNNDSERDKFQISPGMGKDSVWLAYQAHMANEIWNASTDIWNMRLSRRRRARGKRSSDGKMVPEIALHLQLGGEIRLPRDPKSTLYNTDAQIFSDAGIPVVLFMENYDISRKGYHDSHDTMRNIDLDYGASVVAIALEAVARAANEKPFTE
jgi:Zn-dependent M28 family amino/carboxypeptidase